MDPRAEAEFTGFMNGRWSALVRLGYGLTGDQGLAEDLAQTAFAIPKGQRLISVGWYTASGREIASESDAQIFSS
jgi:hypothetical protein